jgi:hypothetical protein
MTFISTVKPKHELSSFVNFETLKLLYGISKFQVIVVDDYFSDLSWIKAANL